VVFFNMPQDQVLEINIDLIDPPENPIRLEPEDEDIERLANSIQSTGLINPITVYKKNERYEVIAGHRRYLAAKLAGLKTVMARVVEGDEKKKVSIMLAENLSRKDLSPMEEASVYAEIQEQWGWSKKQIARVVGKSDRHIATMLKLLEIPNDLQLLVHNRELSIQHAFVLAEIEDPHTREIYTKDCIKRKVSVATLKEWVASLKAAEVLSKGPDEETIQAMKLSATQKTYYTCQVCDGVFPIEKMTNLMCCKSCAIKLMEEKLERNKRSKPD